MKNPDPIVEEAQQARGELYQECNGDLRRLFELMRSAEQDHEERVVASADAHQKRVRRRAG